MPLIILSYMLIFQNLDYMLRLVCHHGKFSFSNIHLLARKEDSVRKFYIPTHESQLAHVANIILVLKLLTTKFVVAFLILQPQTVSSLPSKIKVPSFFLSILILLLHAAYITPLNHSYFEFLLSILKPPDMEISHVVEDNKNEDKQNSQTLLSSKSCVSSQNEYTQEVEPGPPHESLFLVLAYLPLFELLAMSEVCMSLRDAVHNDVLLWLNIIVERPLSLRLSDEILMKITSKASGRLKTLVLIDCEKITDDGLQLVIRKNPHINKV